MIPGVYPPPRSPVVRPDDLRTPDGQPAVGEDKLLIPSHRSFATIYNELSGVYWTKFDEAMRDNPQNALAMRRDVHLRALLQERLMPSVNARRAAEVDDDEDAEQVRVRDQVRKLVGQIPRFSQLANCLLEAVWWGRAGAQGEPGRSTYHGGWTWVNWAPVHGDSLQFGHDDVPIVMVGFREAERWRAKDREAVVLLDRGGWGVRLYKPEYRERFIVHRHQVSAADYFEGEFAGQRHGEGLRSIVYWSNWLRTESFSWMLAYCQGVGSADIICVNYAESNKAAKANAEAIARQITGKIAFAVPRDPKGDWPFIETVPANAQGMQFLRELIEGYFDRGIERLFVGQSMSAGGGGSGGLEGDGRAELARDTKAHLIDFDSANLDETLTADLYEVVKRWNFPQAAFPVRCKASNPEAESQRRLELGFSLIDHGVSVKADEMRQLAGFTKPASGDEVVGGVQPGQDGRDPDEKGDKGPGRAAKKSPSGSERVEYAFDPNQPRDEAGRWRSEGVSAAIGSAPTASRRLGVDRIAALYATALDVIRTAKDRKDAYLQARELGKQVRAAERESERRVVQGVVEKVKGWAQAADTSPEVRERLAAGMVRLLKDDAQVKWGGSSPADDFRTAVERLKGDGKDGWETATGELAEVGARVAHTTPTIDPRFGVVEDWAVRMAERAGKPVPTAAEYLKANAESLLDDDDLRGAVAEHLGYGGLSEEEHDARYDEIKRATVGHLVGLLAQWDEHVGGPH